MAFRAAILLVWLAGCQSVPTVPQVNLSEPGWQLRQGQALWRSKKDAPDVAGEVVVATHDDGRAFAQFLKNPLPLVTAQVGPSGWQIEFVPEGRTFSGSATPPAQLIWLHLLRILQNIKTPRFLSLSKTTDSGIHLENVRTGESITLFLNEK